VTFSIEINSPRWRKHLSSVQAEFESVGSNVVPVIKSNGYGLGQDFLGSVADDLKSSVVAVGTIFEAESMLRSTSADVLVLQPFDARDEIACDVWKSLEESNESHRVIRVISSEESFHAALDISTTTRVLFECVTDLNRFGF
jgi:alanine racemase